MIYAGKKTLTSCHFQPLTALPYGSNICAMHLPRFAMTRRHAALAALAALSLVIMPEAWLFLDSKWVEYRFARQQERQIAWFQGSGFATLTPWEHYDWAMRLLHPPRTKKLFGSGKDTYSIPWVAEPTTDDLKNAIRLGKL